MKEQMDLGGGIFNYFASTSMSWPKCFKELIDNCLDQNGTSIVIRIDNRKLEILIPSRIVVWKACEVGIVGNRRRANPCDRARTIKNSA